MWPFKVGKLFQFSVNGLTKKTANAWPKEGQSLTSKFRYSFLFSGCLYPTAICSITINLLFSETSGVSSQESSLRDEDESVSIEAALEAEIHQEATSKRIFRPRKPQGKLRPISPYETTLLDETLMQYVFKKHKRYGGNGRNIMF